MNAQMSHVDVIEMALDGGSFELVAELALVGCSFRLSPSSAIVLDRELRARGLALLPAFGGEFFVYETAKVDEVSRWFAFLGAAR